jgi:SAM-dependent methyltransferase
MSYAGLAVARSDSAPHLGGSIKTGDPFTYCPSVWDYVVSRFCITSVLDLGCGSGNASVYLSNKGLRVLAVDGFRESVLSAHYPAIQHDLTQSAVCTRVDLVHCQEVVEHIEEKYLDHLLDSLMTGRIILLTHARPGQSGYHHVNLQPSSYWIGHLAARKCVLQEEDTKRVRALAAKDGAIYMAETGMVFANASRI